LIKQNVFKNREDNGRQGTQTEGIAPDAVNGGTGRSSLPGATARRTLPESIQGVRLPENRITDPRQVSREQLDDVLGRAAHATIQFSKPGYSHQVLQNVNDYCAEYGDKLEVRFYGHYSDTFDASILTRVPDVQWLSVDCLQRIDNEDAIARLSKLRKLSFGVYYFDNPGFLATLNLARISRLTLSDNSKKNFDLSPLALCDELEELYLSGHRKNINAISLLPALRVLSLGSIAKSQALEFVNEIQTLAKLTLILGGRENLDELDHTGLNELEVLRVRGLSTLGDLSRFQGLRRLLVEDQLQLKSISLDGSDLEEISIHNCKNLQELAGLLTLKRLRSFRASRTKLDLDSLLGANWPGTMKTVALYSGNRRWNERARQILDERGYSEYASKRLPIERTTSPPARTDQ
jgi:hypothetical protein